MPTQFPELNNHIKDEFKKWKAGDTLYPVPAIMRQLFNKNFTTDVYEHITGLPGETGYNAVHAEMQAIFIKHGNIYMDRATTLLATARQTAPGKVDYNTLTAIERNLLTAHYFYDFANDDEFRQERAAGNYDPANENTKIAGPFRALRRFEQAEDQLQAVKGMTYLKPNELMSQYKQLNEELDFQTGRKGVATDFSFLDLERKQALTTMLRELGDLMRQVPEEPAQTTRNSRGPTQR